MKKVLFVNCCIRREKSRSLKIANEFINSLDKNKYEVEELCLMDEPLEYFKDSFLNKGKDSLLIKNLIIQDFVTHGSLKKQTKL